MRSVQAGSGGRVEGRFEQREGLFGLSGTVGRIIDAVGGKTKRVAPVGTQRPSIVARQGKFEGGINWKAWWGTEPKRDADPARFFNWNYDGDYSGWLMIGQAAQAMRYSGTLDQLVQYNGLKARFEVERESYTLYREDPRAIALKPPE